MTLLRRRSGLLPRTATLAALGLALTGALTVGGSTAASSAPAEGPAGTDQRCEPGTVLAHARTPEGHLHGEDYNSVSLAESEAMQRALTRRTERMRARGALQRQDGTVRVRTFLHVITRADGRGAPTEQQLRQQMGVLNRSYAGQTARNGASTAFRFRLAGIDYTANDDWYDWNLEEDFSDEDAEAKAAKRALRRGGPGALNIYIARLGQGLLGYATFPTTVPLALDGVVVANATLPGGRAAPYNQGDTLTHEVGHWLGLFHTFQNGCEEPGDYVDDTPYQADGDNIFFCGGEFIGADSCPDKPGNDPAKNFMSYGDDPCLKRFTRDQADRMRLVWDVFRAPR